MNKLEEIKSLEQELQEVINNTCFDRDDPPELKKIKDLEERIAALQV